MFDVVSREPRQGSTQSDEKRPFENTGIIWNIIKEKKKKNEMTNQIIVLIKEVLLFFVPCGCEGSL